MMRILTSRLHYMTNKAVLAIGALLAFGLVSFLAPGSAWAGPPATNPNNGNIPLKVQQDAIASCVATGNSVSQNLWLSLPGQPLATTAVVTPGENVQLQWNFGVYYCYDGYDQAAHTSPDITLVSNARVHSVSDSLGTSSFNSLVGDQLAVRYNLNDLWSQSALVFNYTVPNVAPGNYTITVQEINQVINQFNTASPTYEFQCVGTPVADMTWFNVNRGSLSNFTTPNVCPFSNAELPITLDIKSNSKPPGITPIVTNSCTQLEFSAVDPANPNDPVTVSVHNVRTGGAAALLARNGNTYTYDISPWEGYTAEQFIITASDSAGQSPPYTTNPIGPCARFTCGGISPTTVVIGSQFNLITTIDDVNTGADGAEPPAGGIYSITVTGPGGTAFSGPVGYTDNGLISVQNVPKSMQLNTPGNYKVIWSFTVNGVSSGTCPSGGSTGTILAVAEPYFRVYGGDTQVGNGFGNSCTTTTAGIYGWTNPNLGAGNTWNGGAGTQFGELASGQLIGAASAANVGQAPQPILTTPTPNGGAPIGLSFGNTAPAQVNTTPGTDWYGGGFGFGGGPDYCSTDYYGRLPSNATPFSGTTPVPTASGSYTSTNPLGVTLTGGTIPDGAHIVLYVKGNVSITNNIAFANTSWGNTVDIPSLWLIVDGNITIGPNVTRLDGIYVAQPTAPDTNGIISTCDTVNDPYLNCSNPLTVNGAFVADRVQLLRTHGNVISSSVNDTGGNAAEVFNFSPDFMIANPGSLSPAYDSIAGLPPVL